MRSLYEQGLLLNYALFLMISRNEYTLFYNALAAFLPHCLIEVLVELILFTVKIS